MKTLAARLRLAFLVAAVVVTAWSLAPRKADAIRSCEFYCGPAGPYSCFVTENFICPKEEDWP